MPQKSETLSKTEKVYKVTELRDLPIGTRFWHRTLGTCVIVWDKVEHISTTKKAMYFDGDGSERIPWDHIILFIDDYKPWDQPMYLLKNVKAVSVYPHYHM